VLPDALLPEDLSARDPLSEDLPAEDSLLQAGLCPDAVLRPGPGSGSASPAAAGSRRRPVRPGVRPGPVCPEARLLLPVEVLLLLLVR
jgi:hypothetical protein